MIYYGPMREIELSPDSMTRYRDTLRARSARDARILARRKDRALALARKAARILADELGSTRVVLFGSLAHGHWYSMRSDIDLAAWGLGPGAHLEALARLEDLGGDLPVSVVRAEHCGDGLVAQIEQTGIDL